MNPPLTPEQEKFFADLFAFCREAESQGIRYASIDGGDRAYSICLDRIAPGLTAKQEEFLSNLFVRCREAKAHKIWCYSTGKSDRAVYEVHILAID